ncbi:adenosine deaminase [Clostridium estertheticum]|uniref:adenosine deaminase n=1 Tax=Clostridium estertheticum TaxID=238834 RepID=UPI0013E99A4B|nr:adenosine deaminase [Clostridium estertheticum]MBZ9689360.1 adenosine deaminase [Clostridium estertheticum]
MKEKFIKALESNDLDEMRKIPKGDLHNHGSIGGNKRYIEEWADISIAKPPKFKTLNDMQQWFRQNIKFLIKGTLGYEKLIEATFVQAKMDGVKVLNMSFGIGEASEYGNSVENMVQALKRIHQSFAPDVIFMPEIALSTFTPIGEMNEGLEQFLAQDYFKSIDMYGDEFAVPTLKKVFRKAKEKGLILKAHVGEFGTAELVREAVEELELDQIQHGIAAANSQSIMRWLCDNKIQLNICPTSNILLSRVESYKVHPIRKLYDNGIKVTINTDDMLIFDQSVSQEFFNLYNAGLFNATELNEIRENGLSVVFNT